VSIFITLEGIDGAGKSSHIPRLAESLRAAGHNVTITREPGGTPLAEKLRQLLLHDPMDALSEVLLAFAARRDHVQQVIAPALARGEVVLCDRFTDATFAYQGAGRGVDKQVLAQLEQWMCSGVVVREGTLLQPDLTLWFDLPPAIAAQRVVGVRAPDRFESQSTEFFTRVAQGYAERATSAPQRFVRLDATLPLAQVTAHVLAAVAQRGWL